MNFSLSAGVNISPELKRVQRLNLLRRLRAVTTFSLLAGVKTSPVSKCVQRLSIAVNASGKIGSDNVLVLCRLSTTEVLC